MGLHRVVVSSSVCWSCQSVWLRLHCLTHHDSKDNAHKAGKGWQTNQACKALSPAMQLQRWVHRLSVVGRLASSAGFACEEGLHCSLPLAVLRSCLWSSASSRALLSIATASPCWVLIPLWGLWCLGGRRCSAIKLASHALRCRRACVICSRFHVLRCHHLSGLLLFGLHQVSRSSRSAVSLLFGGCMIADHAFRPLDIWQLLFRPSSNRGRSTRACSLLW